MYNKNRTLWRCNLKKIPIITALIIIFSVILFGFFIKNYKSYTYNLNNQFESQASSKLSRVSGTSRTTLDLRLSNELRNISSIAETMRALEVDYSSPKFTEQLAKLSENTVSLHIITDPSDLSSYTDDNQKLDSYYSSLQNNNSIFCTTGDMVYFIIPYACTTKDTVLLVKSMNVYDFSTYAGLNKSEYSGTSYLIDHTGRILATNGNFDANDNLLEQIKSCTFLHTHSYTEFTNNLFAKKTGITSFVLDGTSLYTYYSPTILPDLYLLYTLPTSILDQDSEAITSIAETFMNSVLVIVFLLVIVVLFIGIIYTIKINKSLDKLQLEQQRYKIALSHSKDTIWEYDIKTDTMTKSDANLGLIIGHTTIHNFKDTLFDHQSIHPDDLPQLQTFYDSLCTEEENISVELRALNEKKEYIWYQLLGTKLYDTENKPISVIGQTCNIQKQKLEIESLKQKAGQDKLTKLYNRMTLREKVNDLIACINTPIILGLLIIDIDKFKEINDKLGHLFGDAVLIDVSAKLNKLFQPVDILGRIGGDEFVVVIRNAPSVAYIEDMAKQISNLFHDIYIGEDSDFELTCSIGISLYPSDATDYDNLFEKAELALFNAKISGRDQISLYNISMDNLTQNDSVVIKRNNIDDIDYLHEDRSLVDSSIIANAIEILFDSREIDISINMVLSLIGVYYNLTRIDVLEYGENDNTVSITHEWFSDIKYKLMDQIQKIPTESVNKFSFYQNSENGIFYSDNITDYYNQLQDQNDAIELIDASSVFQCGISDHGVFIGYISASICGIPHVWTKNEVDSLSLLSKVIGSYLIRLRSMQKADMISQRDLLTNAYNFNTFISVANQKLESTENQLYAMMYSDIFQFKIINDNYGYIAGDYILVKLSKIFKEVGGSNSILCRITGDKFALLLPYNNVEDLEGKAKDILIASKQISSEDGNYYKLNVMIGIYMISPNDNAIVSVDRANIARKNAQKNRKENYTFFSEEMRSALIEQKNIEDVMEDALQDDQFIVYYQPKINMKTGKIAGAEALIRWMRPEIGLVSPATFIPLFEDNGFITQLDYYVLDKVCRHLKDQREKGYTLFPISVNFSRQHFKTDSLPDNLLKTVQKYDIPPHLIEVEITESAFVNSDSYWLYTLQQIRKLGFGLAMDDFGSGLSSLNLLCDLPFKVLKIDKDFFHSKTAHKRERIVISNIVRMAHELDMEVICEGVETVEQATFLQSIGCFMAQGYYFDKPLPVEDFDSKYFSS